MQDKRSERLGYQGQFSYCTFDLVVPCLARSVVGEPVSLSRIPCPCSCAQVGFLTCEI